MIEWSPDSTYCLAVGIRHLKMYVPGKTSAKSAPLSQIQKNVRRQGFSSVTFGSSGMAYAGGFDGHIYMFKQVATQSVPLKAHKGTIMCVNAIQEGKDEFLVSGAKDAFIKMWRLAANGTIESPFKEFAMDAMPRSVDFMQGTILAGLSDGSIQEVEVKDGSASKLIESHFDGETWGLAMVKEKGTHRFITSGDDNILYLYDMKLRKVIGRGYVDVKDKSMRRVTRARGGASSQSKFHEAQQSRALAYNHVLNHLAVAKNDGHISIRAVESEQKDANAVISLDNEIDVLFPGKPGKQEWIECIRYNEACDRVAVGSHDNFIYTYKCEEAKYSQ